MKKSLLLISLLIYVFSLSAQTQISSDLNGVPGKHFKNEIPVSKDLTMITHSSTQTITTNNSVSCNSGGLHTNNSYWRKFDLENDFSITTPWDVYSVDIAVETAVGAGGTQPVTVRLYTLEGSFALANLTQIYTEDFAIVDAAAGTVVNLVLTTPVTVPAGSVLVYEFFTPDGQTAGNSFFIGSNADAETDLSYISAADCSLSEPTAVSAIGFPNMHMVMNVWGQPGATLMYNVTFNVDITDSIASGWFVPATDSLFMAGDLFVPTWQTPGSDLQTLMLDADEDGIYTLTVSNLAAATYNYKYFKASTVAPTWDNGEWAGDPNRAVTVVDVDLVVNDVFGDINPGVQDISKGISIYPNPSNGLFNITVESNMSLEVYDITGKLMNTQLLNGASSMQINEAGIYFLRFSNEDGTSTQKVIVQ